MKKFALLFAVLLTCGSFAQDKPSGAPNSVVLVSVRANSQDVRDALYQLFGQAKKSFVLQPNVRFNLNLSLENVEFEEALQVILQVSGLKSEVQNGIYFISKTGTAVPQALTAAEPAGPLPKAVLLRTISTKIAKSPIKAVFAEFTKQTKVRFEIDSSVPAFRIDAALTKATLKFALDQITKASGLSYEFTNRRSIRVFKPAEEANSVSLSQG